MLFELESSVTLPQRRRSYMSMWRHVYKRPLPEACAFEIRLHGQENMENCGIPLLVFFFLQE